MGDRRNVIIHDDSHRPAVSLYTHWGGSSLPATLADALDRGRGRWNDQPYLVRIIFSEMIQDDVLGETGYGIEAVPGRTAYTESSPGYDLIVNTTEETVEGPFPPMSFEEFIALDKEALDAEHYE